MFINKSMDKVLGKKGKFKWRKQIWNEWVNGQRNEKVDKDMSMKWLMNVGKINALMKFSISVYNEEFGYFSWIVWYKLLLHHPLHSTGIGYLKNKTKKTELMDPKSILKLLSESF